MNWVLIEFWQILTILQVKCKQNSHYKSNKRVLSGTELCQLIKQLPTSSSSSHCSKRNAHWDQFCRLQQRKYFTPNLIPRDFLGKMQFENILCERWRLEFCNVTDVKEGRTTSCFFFASARSQGKFFQGWSISRGCGVWVKQQYFKIELLVFLRLKLHHWFHQAAGLNTIRRHRLSNNK